MSLLDDVKEKLGFEDKRPLHVIVKEKAVAKPETTKDYIGLGPFHPFVDKNEEGKAFLDSKAIQSDRAWDKKEDRASSMSKSKFVHMYDRAKRGSTAAKELLDNMGIDLSDDKADPAEIYHKLFTSGKK